MEGGYLMKLRFVNCLVPGIINVFLGNSLKFLAVVGTVDALLTSNVIRSDGINSDVLSKWAVLFNDNRDDFYFTFSKLFDSLEEAKAFLTSHYNKREA